PWPGCLSSASRGCRVALYRRWQRLRPPSTWQSMTPRPRSLLQLLRIQRREHPMERVVRGNPARKRQKTLQPLELGVRVILDLVPSVGPTQDGRDGDQKYLF